jgi:hypothetical protein
MIRLTDPRHLGRILVDLREQRDLGPSRLAALVADATGHDPEAVRRRLWHWETGRTLSPDLPALMQVLDALGYDLALIPREDPR